MRWTLSRSHVQCCPVIICSTLQRRNNGHDGVSNHQPHDCLLNRFFRRRWKNTSKLCITGLCVGNSPVTGQFPAQRVINGDNVSIWWRLHEYSPKQSQQTPHSLPMRTIIMKCIPRVSKGWSNFYHCHSYVVFNMSYIQPCYITVTVKPIIAVAPS